METAQRYAKETFWSISAKAVAFVFYYGLVWYLTRRMTVDVWGRWSAFLALLNIVLLISDQGLNVAVKRYVSNARNSGELAGVIHGTFMLRIVTSLAFALVIAVVLGPLLSWLGQPGYIELMRRSLLLIALYAVVDYFKYVFEALHQLRATFVVTAVEHASKLLFVVFLFRGGSDLRPIVAGLTIGIVIALGAGAVLIFRRTPGLFAARAPSGLLRAAYAYSLPTFLMSIAGFISLEIDTVMMQYLRSDYETGIYAAAKQVVIFLPHIALSVTMGTIPGIAVFDRITAVAQRQLYYRVFAVIMVVYLIVCLSLVIGGGWAITLFFGSKYSAAWTPMVLLLPFVLSNAATVYSGSLMVYRGLAWQRSLNVGVAVIANVLLNWWLIPMWGASGAAVASSLAYLPYSLLNIRVAHKAFALNEPAH